MGHHDVMGCGGALLRFKEGQNCSSSQQDCAGAETLRQPNSSGKSIVCGFLKTNSQLQVAYKQFGQNLGINFQCL